MTPPFLLFSIAHSASWRKRLRCQPAQPYSHKFNETSRSLGRLVDKASFPEPLIGVMPAVALRPSLPD